MEMSMWGNSHQAHETVGKPESILRKGYIQIYYGTGKGKTTAALGLSMRMLLSGGSVYFAQFFKGLKTGELELGSHCNRFILEQFGTGKYIIGEPGEEDVRSAKKGLEWCKEVLKSGYFDLVVMDEVLLCVYYEMITADEIAGIIRSRHPKVEVVMTGRRVPNELLNLADLVTDMRKVKHYFDKGTDARKGIEY